MKAIANRILAIVLFAAVILVPFTSCSKQQASATTATQQAAVQENTSAGKAPQVNAAQASMISTIISKVVKGFDWGFDDASLGGSVLLKDAEVSLKTDNYSFVLSDISAVTKINGNDLMDFNPEELIGEAEISGKITGPDIRDGKVQKTSEIRLIVKPARNYYEDFSYTLYVNGTEYDPNGRSFNPDDMLANLGINIEALQDIDTEDVMEMLTAKLTIAFDDLFILASGKVDGRKASFETQLDGSISLQTESGKTRIISMDADLDLNAKLKYGSDFFEYTQNIKMNPSIDDIEDFIDNVTYKLEKLDFYDFDIDSINALLNEFGITLTAKSAGINGEAVDAGSLSSILIAITTFAINMIAVK